MDFTREKIIFLTNHMSQAEFSDYLYRFQLTIPDREKEDAEKAVCYLANRCARCKCKRESDQDDCYYCRYCETIVRNIIK